jgi:ankyrin repeat protein
MNTRSSCSQLSLFQIFCRVTLALAMLAVSVWILPAPLVATNQLTVFRLARQCSSGKQKACGELAKIALKDKNASVSRYAAASLTDQSLLAKVAVEAVDPSVRSAAAVKLTDQPLLAKIAAEDKEDSVRSAALAELTDQSLLTKIALEATDAGVRSAAVARLTDRSLLAKIAVEDKDATVRSAAVAAAQQVQRDITEGRDIVDLLHEKKIEIQARGDGIRQVSVRMRRLVPYSIVVRIPVGSFFVSSNPSAQNMVTTGESKVELTTQEWVSVLPDAACANRPRHIPGSSDAFTVLRSPHQSELAKLMRVLEKARVDTQTTQAAVWIVTDNADYNDLGILVGGSFNGFRVINQLETARAMRICDDAGIDITRKAIWKDRQRIIFSLKDRELKTWLQLKDNPDLVFSRDNQGVTPLHSAALEGQKDLAELLLANKAEVNARDNVGGTPLHYAAATGHRDVAVLLLANKAVVDARANNGVTPLHAAAAQGHKDVMELLLANKADINARATDGETPLHMAAVRGRKDVVEFLLAKGAEVNAKANQGLTPLDLAAAQGHKDVVELLRQHGGQE